MCFSTRIAIRESAGMLSRLPAREALLDLSGANQKVGGYDCLMKGPVEAAPDTTTDEYAVAQERDNAAKVLAYLVPRIERAGARSVLDVGCGVGAMVGTLLGQGYDAYGVDLPGLHTHWARLQLPKERMFVVDAEDLRLPFVDGGVDFAYTFGVIEHVGTSDGQSTRLPDYHHRRRQWLREV